ncbi:hypothetical protein AGDE_15338 [Angomonas deanei]|uniref:Uncharacterized protein n=1 Tax=Angomonas deanei TaxID=59799 RepID=A0A7G2CBZ8_9TRYP|nr:hypothetical protein AGDE_15338 [Angomonas deanei]CAD2215592.1 hypothetical protein, conserved [Angomonas deanei]|eukprot:EPY19251.1 hypothetical protein AGDE_15338 [Angomonas deanei]
MNPNDAAARQYNGAGASINTQMNESFGSEVRSSVNSAGSNGYEGENSGSTNHINNSLSRTEEFSSTFTTTQNHSGSVTYNSADGNNASGTPPAGREAVKSPQKKKRKKKKDADPSLYDPETGRLLTDAERQLREDVKYCVDYYQHMYFESAIVEGRRGIELLKSREAAFQLQNDSTGVQTRNNANPNGNTFFTPRTLRRRTDD